MPRTRSRPAPAARDHAAGSDDENRPSPDDIRRRIFAGLRGWIACDNRGCRRARACSAPDSLACYQKHIRQIREVMLEEVIPRYEQAQKAKAGGG